MELDQLLLGQIPEAIYFALFIIFTKQLKEKKNIIEASALQTLNEAKKYADDQIQKNITKTLGGEY